MSSQAVRKGLRQSGGWLPVWCAAVGLALAACGCPPRESVRAESGSGTITGQKPPAKARPADNSECLICHMDFKTELLSIRHEKAGIGCTGCHGASLAHGDDELNVTPPDRLFGRAEIVPFCTACHATHKTGEAYKAFLKRWHSKRRPNGRMVLNDSVCTDCHGNHAVLRIDQKQLISN